MLSPRHPLVKLDTPVEGNPHTKAPRARGGQSEMSAPREAYPPAPQNPNKRKQHRKPERIVTRATHDLRALEARTRELAEHQAHLRAEADAYDLMAEFFAEWDALINQS